MHYFIFWGLFLAQQTANLQGIFYMYVQKS